MRRREFITLVGGAVMRPLAARAQSGKIWRMGFIAHGHETHYDALFRGLRELGYEEGQNLVGATPSGSPILRRRWSGSTLM
jgi:putative ABC transport system substrate-binding protein